MQTPLKFVISAPSAAGKNTLISMLQERDARLHLAKSWTTRPPMPGDTKYHHTTTEDFMKRVEEGWFLEWERNYEHLYGTCKQGLPMDADSIFEVDCKGAFKLKENDPSIPIIFILPPCPQTLERRLRSRRRGESPENIEKRLAAARIEVACASEFDYWILNQVAETAADQLRLLIMYIRSGLRPGPEYRNYSILEEVQASFGLSQMAS